MSEAIEILKAYKEYKKEVKENRLANADVTGWQKLSDYHYRKWTTCGRLDWWPNTNKCRVNGKNYKRDSDYIKNLLGEQQMNNLQTILTERESQYGSFSDFADKFTDLQEQFKNFENYKHLTNGNRIAIEMILFKCCRLLNGNQDHKDTWLDIGGYASLIVEQRLPSDAFELFNVFDNEDINMVLFAITWIMHDCSESHINGLIDYAKEMAEQC